MGDKLAGFFDEKKFVAEIPNNAFHEEFVNKLGRTKVFSKLRSGGEDRMTAREWAEINSAFQKMGTPRLSHEQIISLAYELTARAVQARF